MASRDWALDRTRRAFIGKLVTSNGVLSEYNIWEDNPNTTIETYLDTCDVKEVIHLVVPVQSTNLEEEKISKEGKSGRQLLTSTLDTILEQDVKRARTPVNDKQESLDDDEIDREIKTDPDDDAINVKEEDDVDSSYLSSLVLLDDEYKEEGEDEDNDDNKQDDGIGGEPQDRQVREGSMSSVRKRQTKVPR